MLGVVEFGYEEPILNEKGWERDCVFRPLEGDKLDWEIWGA